MKKRWIVPAASIGVALAAVGVALLVARGCRRDHALTDWTLPVPAHALKRSRELLTDAQSADPEARYAALKALLQVPDRTLVEPMRVAVARGDHPANRFLAARILAKFGDRTGEPVLLDGLSMKDMYFRSAALQDLASLNGESARPHLERALEDEMPDVRARAGALLLRFGDRSAYDRFAAEALDTNRPVVERLRALRALGFLPPDPAVPRLLERLLSNAADPAPRVLVEAVERAVGYVETITRDVLGARLQPLKAHADIGVRDAATAAERLLRE